MNEEQQILQMAALIAAVRTVKFDTTEFQSMSTPRVIGALQASLWLARKLCEIHRANVARDAHEPGLGTGATMSSE